MFLFLSFDSESGKKFYRYFITRDIVSGTNCISVCNYPQVITRNSSKSGHPINSQLLPSCHNIKSTKLEEKKHELEMLLQCYCCAFF